MKLSHIYSVIFFAEKFGKIFTRDFWEILSPNTYILFTAYVQAKNRITFHFSCRFFLPHYNTGCTAKKLQNSIVKQKNPSKIALRQKYTQK